MKNNFLLLLFAFSCFFANAQAISSEDSSRLEVLNAIKGYIRDVIQINPGPMFYTEWVKDSGMLNYVYVSRTDVLRPPDSSFKIFLSCGYDSLKADSICKVHTVKGFHVTHYRTVTNGVAKLSRVLMDSPLEAFVSSVIHEAVHRHIRVDSLNLLYSMEEALCDVVANHYTPLFLKKSASDYLAACRQAEQNEDIYKVINAAEDRFVNTNANPEEIYIQTKRQLDVILKECNDRQKLRFDYPVNNAFLLRNHYYSHYYFFIKDILKERRANVKEVSYLLSKLRVSKEGVLIFR